MDATYSTPVTILSPGDKRPCIKIKARIKIQGDQEPLASAVEAKPPYQAYCETVSSSRPQSPDVFTTPPTHSEPFPQALICKKPTYTARITTRRATVSNVVDSASEMVGPEKNTAPITLPTSNKICNRSVSTCQMLLQGNATPKNPHYTVSRSTSIRGSHSKGVDDPLLRNRAPPLSQTHEANIDQKPTVHIITSRTPLRKKRYGRMDCHPLPPLPPPPPVKPFHTTSDTQYFGKETINLSRGEVKHNPAQQQGQVYLLRQSRAEHSPRPGPPPAVNHRDVNLANATAGHERPQSKASRRTVTFADDATQSSRSSSPDHHSHVHGRTLRQSKSFSLEPQVRSSLRLYRSHDNLLTASTTAENDAAGSLHASRRTAPKDFKHRYAFGQRPPSRIAPPPSLGRTTNANYNPRLSTSKAQYRGLATLPRPLPSSLRVVEPQIGPRRPPWGSLDNLEERREKRVGARERHQVKQFRAATLSEATTLGSTDSFGREKMKKEVEEYKEQVMSVYPDMAFDGNAGKGGRSCCCAVM